MITIADLSKAKLEAGKTYRLDDHLHVISQTVKIPSNVTIESSNATIVYEGSNPPLWSTYGSSNVRIGKMQYKIGPENCIAFIEHGANIIINGAKIIGSPRTSDVPGGFAILRNAQDIYIGDVFADTIKKYLIFAEAGCNNLYFDRLKLNTGSTHEAGIRLTETKDVILNQCELICTLNKKSSLRMQDGERFTVIGGRYVGNFGAGPLGKGDGGRAWGISRWYLTNGKTVDGPKPADVDLDRTLEKREQMLGRRMNGVTVIDAKIEGGIVLEAGLSDYMQAGGSVTFDPIFVPTAKQYPDEQSFTLEGDTIRRRAQGKMIGVKIVGNPKNNPIDMIDCNFGGSVQTMLAA